MTELQIYLIGVFVAYVYNIGSIILYGRVINKCGAITLVFILVSSVLSWLYLVCEIILYIKSKVL